MHVRIVTIEVLEVEVSEDSNFSWREDCGIQWPKSQVGFYLIVVEYICKSRREFRKKASATHIRVVNTDENMWYFGSGTVRYALSAGSCSIEMIKLERFKTDAKILSFGGYE